MKKIIVGVFLLSVVSFNIFAAGSTVYDSNNDVNTKKIQRTLEQNNKILLQQNSLLKQILEQQIIANKQVQQEQKEMNISEFSSTKNSK